MARGGPLCSALGGVYGCRACSPAPAFLEQRQGQRQGQRQRQKPQGCVLAGRGGFAGDGKDCIHAGLVSRHPWRSTLPPAHPAPPSTGSWWSWVGATAFLLPPIAVAAHGNCLGSGGWAAGDRPTGTYLRRVPCSPPARPSQEITALLHHRKNLLQLPHEFFRRQPRLRQVHGGHGSALRLFFFLPSRWRRREAFWGRAGGLRGTVVRQEPNASLQGRTCGVSPAAHPPGPARKSRRCPTTAKTYFNFLTNSSGVSPGANRKPWPTLTPNPIR